MVRVVVSYFKKYNISDNGLRKACMRMGVALPNAGHWSKLKAGKQVMNKPLSADHEGDQQMSMSLRMVGDNTIEAELSPQIRFQKEIEQDSSLDLNVKEVLTNPDTLIVKAEKALTKDKRYKFGDLLYAGAGNLDIKVSPDLVNRALRIMDTFIKAMRQRGHDFRISDTESYIVLGEEEVKMVLKEMQTKVTVKDTWERTELRAKGLLCLQFEKFIGSVSCTDGKKLFELAI